MKKLSLYLHIPFCIRKCSYCDFLSAPSTPLAREAYVSALIREMEQEAVHYRDFEVDTIFVGGGTPSVLETGLLERVFETITSRFRLSETPEITLELNPGTVDKQKFVFYRQMGINRLSIGLQSTKDKELKLLGRVHSLKEFEQAYFLAREVGFENLNIDLMAALPGQTREDFLESLHGVLRYEPEHISAYSLIMEKGTLFYEWEKQGLLPPVLPEEQERELDHETEQILAAAGYGRYEISNYAREGRQCRHNKVYWTRENYAGFGVGAASMVDNVRWCNTKDLEKYLENAGDMGVSAPKKDSGLRGKRSLKGIKTNRMILGIREQMEEFMFLGLRLTEGVSCAEFEACFGSSMESVYGKLLKKLESQGLLQWKDKVKLTTYGRDISNFVLSEFLFV